jgi:gluconate:H+ symporter, GntP family
MNTPLSQLSLILLVGAAIGTLVALVTWRKTNAFLALFIAALIVGIGAGRPVLGVVKAFQEGLGVTLGGIAAVIALGAMIGKLLSESGGAQVLAGRFSRFFGPERAGLCIMALALAVGLVTWFAVGLLLLLPVLITLTKETKRPLLALAIPLLAFLSVMHGLMPPHPGPVVAIDALGANMGKVLVLGFLVGIPTAAVAGPFFARWAVRRVTDVVMPVVAVIPSDRPQPSFAGTMLVLGLPVGLMLLSTVAELWLPAGGQLRQALTFVGHPVVALTVAVFVALRIFGRAARFTRTQLLGFTEQSVGSIGMTLLVVGAGGGFSRVLRDAGVADALGQWAGEWHLPPLVYGWLVAAFIRVATGSATVAITTAAGLLVPVLAAHPEINRELLVLSLGFGSLFLSHLNDGGFWIVKESLGLTVGQTLRTWTLTETIIGVAGLGFTLLLSLVW